MQEPLLKLEHVSVQYGGIQALDDVDIEIAEGEIVVLMGPNGAGKSTVLKSIAGLAPTTSGSISWKGERHVAITHQLAARGISYVPQGRQIFKSLTVYENLELGGLGLCASDRTQQIEDVLAMFPVLTHRLHDAAGTLSGGQQQMLAIARGLISRPRLILLDEPSLGLAPNIVRGLFELIHQMNERQHIAFLLVEHSIKSALAIAHRAYVLSCGAVVAHKPANEIEGSKILEEVFLDLR